MKIGDIFKISRKTFFNPTAWIGYDAIKSQHETIRDDLKEVFQAEKPIREETFDEAMQRLALTPEDVHQRMVSFRRYAYTLFICGLLVFLYSFHLLFKLKQFTPWFLGIAASLLFFVQAFRFHFWAYQIEVRKLGVSITEWKNHLLGIKSPSP